MKILFAASEVVPFAKTGGLADVAGALPKKIMNLGHKVSVVMPLYGKARQRGGIFLLMDKTIFVPVGDRIVEGKIWQSRLPDSEVDIYFIENDNYYDRSELYGTSTGSYQDNAQRFIFFSRGVLETIKALSLKVDVIHCNDWHTALIPVYLKTLYKNNPLLKDVATVFTLHNLFYQGSFERKTIEFTGLSGNLLGLSGKVNFMKGGLVYADLLTTVSRRYAREIQTQQFGFGLEQVLLSRSGDLYGIINGLDYKVWNPKTDNLLPANYNKNDLSGKMECKRVLQRENGLSSEPNIPLLGLISRLDDQKGLDLIAGVIDDIMELGVQFILLGTGKEKYHQLFTEIGARYPSRVRINLTFDDRLAHLIEAGADIFLMPSRFEPCGLNQLISLKYGTAPVVSRTGGLADTIVNYTPKKLEEGKATGFLFSVGSSRELLASIKKAVRLYHDRDKWTKLIQNGMSQDWSWGRSAREYVKLYQKAIESRLSTEIKNG